MNGDDFIPELPPPVALKEQLIDRAWSDQISDRDRLLLEQASRVIGRLVKTNRRFRRQLREQQEARR